MRSPEECLAKAEALDELAASAPVGLALEFARLAQFWRDLAERPAQLGESDLG